MMSLDAASCNQCFCSFAFDPSPRPWIKRARTARAALVKAGPPPPARVVPASRDANFTVRADRTEDLQEEARAMACAFNASVYSPQVLSVKYGSRPIKVLRRTLEILIALGSFGLTLLMDQRNGVFDRNKRKRAAQLTRTLGLSTRSDIYPPEYLEELSELQDALPRKRAGSPT